MTTLSTGKIAEVMFESAIETHEKEDLMLGLVEFFEPPAGDMQNSGNYVWRPVQQNAPVLTGTGPYGSDLSGLETGIIEETYPATLGNTKNDFVKQTIFDMRDMRFWKRRGEESGRKQVSELNQLTAHAMGVEGSLFYESDADSGFDFISEAQARMNERQLYKSQRCFLLNDRSTQKFGKDLAARQTIQGKPDETWRTGQIGNNIAEFDVYTGSFLPPYPKPTLSATVTSAAYGQPQGGSVGTDGNPVENIDYRIFELEFTGTLTGIWPGAKISLGTPGTADAVWPVSLMDKKILDLGTTGGVKDLMTFTVKKIDGQNVTISPNPIPLVGGAQMDTLKRAYANVDKVIAADAAVNLLNEHDAVANLFWDKSAVEIIGGALPAQYFKEFAGKKVLSQRMRNGLTMYMVYDGNIDDLTFKFRLFTWYGITIANPSNVGIAVAYS